MKAGVDLDVLVHEKVFGLISGGPLVLVPEYSTDIAAAWEVVEKLAAEEKHLALLAPGAYTDEGLGPQTGWSAVFNWPHDRWGHDSTGSFQCETAPLAISLAALKAKGVEVE